MINFKVDNLKRMRRELADFAEYLKGNSVCEDDVFSESGRGLYIVRSVIWGDIERGEKGEVTVYIKRH